MDASERTWLSSDTMPRRCSPAAGILALGVAGGAFAGILLVTPLVVNEVRDDLNAQRAESEAAWERHAAAMYARGYEDALALAEAAREAGQ